MRDEVKLESDQMMNESQSRPQQFFKKIFFRVSSFRDLIRLIVSLRYVNFSQSIYLFFSKRGRVCKYFRSYIVTRSQKAALEYVFYFDSLCSKEIGEEKLVYSFKKEEKLKSFNEKFLEEESFTIDLIKVLEDNISENVELAGNTNNFILLESINFIELVRFATYFNIPIFVFKNSYKDEYIYLTNLLGEKFSFKYNNIDVPIIIFSKGPKPETKSGKRAYFVKFVEEKNLFEFDRGVKYLDKFSPIINLSRIPKFLAKYFKK